MEKIAVWRALECEGLEYLTLRQGRATILALSTVIAVNDLASFRLHYQVSYDKNYVVRGALLKVAKQNGHESLYLASDLDGNWKDDSDNPLSELDGCIDVDISATPFTNTLPIRRIQWQAGQAEVFQMVYILVPDLKVSVMRQRYTCLEKSDAGATFRYENMDDDFKADITVDSDGLVLNYPGLFERII